MSTPIVDYINRKKLFKTKTGKKSYWTRQFKNAYNREYYKKEKLRNLSEEERTIKKPKIIIIPYKEPQDIIETKVIPVSPKKPKPTKKEVKENIKKAKTRYNEKIKRLLYASNNKSSLEEGLLIFLKAKYKNLTSQQLDLIDDFIKKYEQLD